MRYPDGMDEETQEDGSPALSREQLVAGPAGALRVQSETVVLATVAPDGTITHIDESLLDEVATVLWDETDVQRLSAYSDLFYADLPLLQRDTVRAIARRALMPLLRRLATGQA